LRLVDAREGSEHLHVLSGALRGFAEATTDYERLLDVVARTLAEVVKDGCVVRLLSEGGALTPVAIHVPVPHVSDPEVMGRFRAHLALQHNISEQAEARRVIETGEPLLVPSFDLSQLWATTAPEILHAYELVGIHSVLVVALRLRGKSLGLLTLVRFGSTSPPFGEEDLELAQALADHAALALSNARLLSSTLRELGERERAEVALQRSEEQLRNALKMEAVGRLAGGIAHDFNNLLSVILSQAEFVAAEFSPGEPLLAEIKEIQTAGMRAADLTKQLLAFSRQQVLDARVLDLNQNVAGTEKLLRRLLGAGIDLTMLPATDLWHVKADSGQINQIVMNLALNARDAMPNGGKLTIQTGNVELDAEYADGHLGVLPGSYVMLAVTDTGLGMDAATQARIFEPFFTTKEQGKGTGLGLATVFGIVKQSAGHIWVYSELGVGTTFKAYFPRTSGPAELGHSEHAPPDTEQGSETILLVEDDEQVRAVARSILRRQGYVVLDAPNGGEALLICEQHGAKIHLLLTDMVLPRMTGRQLAARLQPTRPEMKVLFMSGYSGNAVLQHGMLDSGLAYLEKPLRPGSLTRKVRQVLRGSSAQ
jgi:signal transduction histidine kinase/CheY-like chemotaxis protein